MSTARAGSVSVRFVGVRADVRKALTRAVARLRTLGPVNHRVRVVVSPHSAVAAGELFGFGLFVTGETPTIRLAGGMVRDLERGCGYPPRDAVDAVVWTFLHEWAHYEQFRDGRPLAEHAANRRADSLMRTLGRTERREG